MSELWSAQTSLARKGSEESLSTNMDADIRAGVRSYVGVRARVLDRRYSAEEEGSRPGAHQTQTLRKYTIQSTVISPYS